MRVAEVVRKISTTNPLILQLDSNAAKTEKTLALIAILFTIDLHTYPQKNQKTQL